MFCNENGFDFYAVLWCNARLASILPVKQRLFYIPIMITTFFFGKLKQLLWKQTTKIRRTIKMHRSLMRNIFCWEVNWFYMLHLPCVLLHTFSKNIKKIEYIMILLSATGPRYECSQSQFRLEYQIVEMMWHYLKKIIRPFYMYCNLWDSVCFVRNI